MSWRKYSDFVRQKRHFCEINAELVGVSIKGYLTFDFANHQAAGCSVQ